MAGLTHLRGGDEHPCVFLLFHMLSDIHLFLGVFCSIQLIYLDKGFTCLKPLQTYLSSTLTSNFL
jgi:hypothetical protein